MDFCGFKRGTIGRGHCEMKRKQLFKRIEFLTCAVLLVKGVEEEGVRTVSRHNS